ncbi:MAG: type II secretion system F family protein [Chloroflexota bacterium]
MSLALIFLIAMVALGLVGASIYLMRRAEDDPLSARISEFAARDEPVSIEEIELSLSFSDRIVLPLVRRVSDFVVHLTPQTTLERTARQLELAGSPRNMTAAEFWAIRGVATILLSGLFFLLMVRFNVDPSKRLLYTVLMGALGYYLPQLMLRARIDRRKRAVVKMFPDALDLMTICVDAGLTFDGAMAKVDEKWDDDLAREFGRVVYEMQLGKARRQALRDMSDRMDVPDVTSFVAAILQADQLGVSIGKVLRIQSEQMRIRRRQRAEEKAQQAPVKMSFPLVFLIFPSVLIVLLAPAILQVLKNNALRGLAG